MKKRDIVLFKKVAHFYSYLGNFPYIQKKNKLLLVAYYIIAITCFLKVLVNLNLIFSSKIGLVICASFLFLNVVFSLLCLRNVFVHETLWNNLFTDVDTFDFIVKEEKVSLTETVYKFYLKFAIVTVGFFSMYILTFALHNRDNHYKIIGASYYFLVNMQLTITTISIDKLLMIIGKRFDLLKRILRETYIFREPNKDIRNKQQLITLYLLLMNMVKKTNGIFGQKILIILFSAFLCVILCFHFITYEHLEGGSSMSSKYLPAATFMTTIYVVSTIH